jgi:hypothetical protein
MINLDQQSALYAYQLVTEGLKAKNNAKAVENLVTKTLGVLQEQGVYACMLFLFSRRGDEKKIAEKMRPSLYQLLGELPAFKDQAPSATDDIKAVLHDFYAKKVCQNLDTLLLVKELYEQTLIYARYTAKAKGQEAV